MYPNQNQNQAPGQYSIDYLNQIAPQPEKKGMNNKMFLLFVGGGIVLALLLGIIVLSNGGNGPHQQMETLAARLQTLQTISKNSQTNIKSSQLRSTNSNLTIFLTNANADIVSPLQANGIDPKNIDKSIVTAESGTDLTNKLTDAKLNAVFDATYAREMGYQVDTLIALMKDIDERSNSKSMKAFIESTDKNLEPIKDQLYTFNATST